MAQKYLPWIVSAFLVVMVAALTVNAISSERMVAQLSAQVAALSAQTATQGQQTVPAPTPAPTAPSASSGGLSSTDGVVTIHPTDACKGKFTIAGPDMYSDLFPLPSGGSQYELSYAGPSGKCQAGTLTVQTQAQFNALSPDEAPGRPTVLYQAKGTVYGIYRGECSMEPGCDFTVTAK